MPFARIVKHSCNDDDTNMMKSISMCDATIATAKNDNNKLWWSCIHNFAGVFFFMQFIFYSAPLVFFDWIAESVYFYPFSRNYLKSCRFVVDFAYTCNCLPEIYKLLSFPCSPFFLLRQIVCFLHFGSAIFLRSQTVGLIKTRIWSIEMRWWWLLAFAKQLSSAQNRHIHIRKRNTGQKNRSTTTHINWKRNARHKSV